MASGDNRCGFETAFPPFGQGHFPEHWVRAPITRRWPRARGRTRRRFGLRHFALLGRLSHIPVPTEPDIERVPRTYAQGRLLSCGILLVLAFIAQKGCNYVIDGKYR